MADIAAGLQRLIAAARRGPAPFGPIVSVSERRGVVRTLRWPLGRVPSRRAEALSESGLALVGANPDLFGAPALDRAALVDTGEDGWGGFSVIVQQRHGARQVPVRGGAARFHADGDGVIDGLQNRLFVDLGGVPDEPRLAAAEAQEAARAALAAEVPPIATAPRPVRRAELAVISHAERAWLTWQVWLAEDPRYGDRVFVAHVEAQSGAVLEWLDITQEGEPAQGTGRGHYAARPVALQTWREGPGRFVLRDVTREPVVIVTHVDGNGAVRVSETPDNDWSAPPHRAEADAHHFAGLVADYFRARGGRHRKLGDGGNIRIHVHAPVASAGGTWDPAAKVIRLSDGDGQTWGPCTSLDWMAHELAHSYIQATCDLVYRGESGALSEAIADTFAALIREHHGASAVRTSWGRFRESWRGRRPRAPYRNMVDPHNKGEWSAVPHKAAEAMRSGCGPHHVDEMYEGSSDGFRWDHGGVHVNSGIINHLFYLLARGGRHRHSGIRVDPIGNRKLEELLFYCLERHLPVEPGCDFRNFRRHMVAACQELFPRDLSMLERLKRAFRAVGIGPELIIRDHPDDDGMKPVPARSAQRSPDVINRPVRVPRPGVELGDPARHDLAQDIRRGQDNFVYVRVRNRGSGIADATVSVFLAAEGEAESPAAWRAVPAADTSVAVALGIARDEFRVVGPFVLRAADVPAPGRYAQIGTVSSAFDPVPPYEDTIAPGEYLAYLRRTNNVAARRVRVLG